MGGVTDKRPHLLTAEWVEISVNDGMKWGTVMKVPHTIGDLQCEVRPINLFLCVEDIVSQVTHITVL